jgi:hypothetical protein
VENADAEQDFAQTRGYAISGTANSGGTPLANVTIGLTGPAGILPSQSTASDGTYAFSGLPSGDYIVTPGLTGYAFSPAEQALKLNGADLTAQPFVGYSSAPTNASPVRLSRSSGTASPARIRLTFTGALTTTSATVPSHYFLTGSGTVVPVLSAAYAKTSDTVTLSVQLPTGRNSITVHWVGLFDTQGRPLDAGTTAVTPR